MKNNVIHHPMRISWIIAGIATVSVMLTVAGCGNKTSDTASDVNTPPATKSTSTNVPAGATQAGSAEQKFGDQRGQQAAANAAAYKAARDKAGGK